MATVQPAGMRDRLESTTLASHSRRKEITCFVWARCIIHEALWLNALPGHEGGVWRPKQSRVLLLRMTGGPPREREEFSVYSFPNLLL